MDSSYSRVVISDVADSSVVVEVGVDVRLSLSLTLAVHVVKTRVIAGVHRRNSNTTDNRGGDGVVGVVDSSMDSGYSSVVDSGYSVGNSTNSAHRVRVVDSGNMNKTSVVEGLGLSLRFSLTLSVQMVQTSVHVRVESRSVVHTSNIVDRNGVVDSVDRMSIIDSSYMADGTVSNSSVARDDTMTMVNSSHDSTVCQTMGDLSYGVRFSFSISIHCHSGQK